MGGQGSTTVPAHIYEKINIWDRKNYENSKTAQSSYDTYVAKNIQRNLNYENKYENRSSVSTVKPWTPTQNLKRPGGYKRGGKSSDKSYTADLLQQMKIDRQSWEAKQSEWIENEQSQRTMLQSLRQDNQNLRYENEKLQKLVQHLRQERLERDVKYDNTILNKEQQIENITQKYANLEGKYKIVHKELKAYEMDNLKRRRSLSFNKKVEATGWG